VAAGHLEVQHRNQASPIQIVRRAMSLEAGHDGSRNDQGEYEAIGRRQSRPFQWLRRRLAYASG
jgi:hypothetical protein